MDSGAKRRHLDVNHWVKLSGMGLAVIAFFLGDCRCHAQGPVTFGASRNSDHPGSDAHGSPGRLSHTNAPQTLEVLLPQGRLVGLPVHWDDYSAALLASNGRFHVFDVEDVRRHRRLEDEFRPQSLMDARSDVQAELGKNYETLIAGPYVIAAPRGEARRWRSRFTALLSGYTRYFELRGWPLRQPDFPLVVVVFQSRTEFLSYSKQQSGRLPSQAVGSYFPKSNRCVLYQIPGARGTNWSETEATIVHEAVHQLAYNTGVHERLSENPLWFVEGLATMFEQPAVYDLGVSRSTIKTRMNLQKVAQLQPLLSKPAEVEMRLRSLIESDQLYRTEPHTAYALGWAMTFYLAERMSSEYQRFVDLQSHRPFGPYGPTQRLRDFHAAFQVDPSMLTIQMIRLLQR